MKLKDNNCKSIRISKIAWLLALSMLTVCSGLRADFVPAAAGGPIGPGLGAPVIPHWIPGKEYSNNFDHDAGIDGGVPAEPVGVPYQQVAWDGRIGTSGAQNALEYYSDSGSTGAAGELIPNQWVDALANHRDELIFNLLSDMPTPEVGEILSFYGFAPGTTPTPLAFSTRNMVVTASATPGPLAGPSVAPAAGSEDIYYEEAAVALAGKWAVQKPPLGEAEGINHHDVMVTPSPMDLIDVDGLELFGTAHPARAIGEVGDAKASSDATLFSVDALLNHGPPGGALGMGDVAALAGDPTRYSVYAYDGGVGPGSVTGYLPQAMVVAMITPYFPTLGSAPDLAEMIDLDALMAYDMLNDNIDGEQGFYEIGPNGDIIAAGAFDVDLAGVPRVFGPGDILLFSVEALAAPDDLTGMVTPGYGGLPDGGEIFVGFYNETGVGSGVPLIGSLPVGPIALPFSHGGHIWDSAFPVLGTYGGLGFGSEDVNAIEALATPEPSTYALLGTTLMAIACSRRKSFAF